LAKAVRPFAEKDDYTRQTGRSSQAINFIGLLPIVRPPVESPEVAALEEILQSRDLAIAIQGPAGAGKTTFAAEAVRAIEALSGKDVMVLAPSSSAVNELRSRVTPKAETIQTIYD
jgi:superfamily II DNA or RNA helicase